MPGGPVRTLLLGAALSAPVWGQTASPGGGPQASPAPLPFPVNVGHHSAVRALAAHPTRPQLASAGTDGVRVWDLTTPSELLPLRVSAGARSLAFTPDGAELVIGGDHGQILVRPLQPAQPFRQWSGHAGPVLAVAVDGGSRRIASAGEDSTLRLWNRTEGREERRIQSHTAPVTAVAFQPQGMLLASGSKDRTVRFWNPASGAAVGAPVTLSQAVHGLAFQPNGKRLAVLTEHSVQILEVPSGRTVGTLPVTTSGPLRWSADGQFLSVPEGQQVVQWHADRIQRLDASREFGFPVTSMAYPPGGKLLAVAGASPAIQLWTSDGLTRVGTLEGDLRVPLRADFSPDGSLLALSNREPGAAEPTGNTILWDLRTGSPHSVLSDADRPGSLLRFTAGARTLIWDSDEQYLTSHEPSTARPLGVLDPTPDRPVADDEKPPVLYHWTASFDGRLAASAPQSPVPLQSSSIVVWSRPQKRELTRITTRSRVTGLELGDDGKLLLSTGDAGALTLWDVATRKPAAEVRSVHPRVAAVALSPDSRWMAAVSSSPEGKGAVELWSVADHQRKLLFEGTIAPESVVFSRDGRTLFAGFTDGSIRVWDRDTGSLFQTLLGGYGPCRALAVHPGHRLLAAVDAAGVRLWRRDGETWTPVATLLTFRDASWVVAAPDGTYEAGPNFPDVAPLGLSQGLQKSRRWPTDRRTPGWLASVTAPLVPAGALKRHPTLRYSRDTHRLPYRSRWGSYWLQVEPVANDQEEHESYQRLQIFDAAGQLVREALDDRIDELELLEINGTGAPELHIATNAGGNHAVETHYYFTCDGGLRNLSAFGGDGLQVRGHNDLDGDGRPEIITFAPHRFWGAWPGALYQYRALILKWKGSQFVDVTSAYPERVRAAMASSQKDFLRAKREADPEALEAYAAGYLVHALCIGEGAAAWKWLQQQAPRPTMQWLQQHRAEITREAGPATRRAAAKHDRTLESESYKGRNREPFE